MISPSRTSGRWQASGSSIRVLAALISLCLLIGATSSEAKLRIDFNQAFYVHPGYQTWDFCVIRPDSVYHLFYHAIAEDCAHASCADTIYHAVSPDLRNWELIGPAVAVGQGYWDEGAVWAPDVVWDGREQRWAMAYTGADPNMNQRICFAYSDNLKEWVKASDNPIIVPDSGDYMWWAEGWWGDFRDPFLYRDINGWHILVTAKQMLEEPTGVLFHAVSPDLNRWTDVGPLFRNDGPVPELVLESPQYHIRNGAYHLLFGEFDTIGISHVAAAGSDTLTMDNRSFIDDGYAPEIDSFDRDIDIFSRLTVFSAPSSPYISYVIRFDTLLTDPDTQEFSVHMPHPLLEHWEHIAGASNLANPTFGDNPAFRGEDPIGVVGNGYYGSGEYYMGPLASSGNPGTNLGPSATGSLESYPFVLTGSRIDLLVGGGHYPETCYVALVDAATDTVLFKATGDNDPALTPRTWLLDDLYGRLVYLAIVDAETDTMGFINIDEIIESGYGLSATPDVQPAPALIDLGPAPNPFNPSTQLRFHAATAGMVEARIVDLRGRLIWSSQPFQCRAGANEVTWRGLDHRGRAVPAGTYLYTLRTERGKMATGKLSLVK